MLRCGLPGSGVLIVLGISLCLPNAAGATTYYVAPGGNDSAQGTVSAPWQHPAYGAGRLQPGDTLILEAGVYVLADYENDILRPPSGSASNWITIKGEEGGTVILAGRDNLAMAMELGGRTHIRIENLEITHDPAATDQAAWFRDGISMVDGPAAHIVLSKLRVHHVDEFGIDARDVDDLQILDSHIHHCGFGAVGGPAGTAGGLRNVVVRGCSLSWSGHYYQGGDGSGRPYDRPDGFGIEPSSGPVLIEETTAEHNFGDGLDSKAGNTTVRRCIVANNTCDGVKLWAGGSRVENTLIYGRGDGDPQVTPWAAVVIDTTEADASFELLNVTVDDQLGSNYLAYVQYDHPVPISVTIRNCVFRGTGPNCPIWFRDTVSLALDHNLFWLPASGTIVIHGAAEYAASTIGALGTANASADPLFLAPSWGSTGDYHLAAGSPAIDAGTTSGAPASDLDGRVRDGQPDLGAYEYAGGGAGCVLACSPTVPQNALVHESITFHAGLWSQGCNGVPTMLWQFGDGVTSSTVDPSHAYDSAGTFMWYFHAAVDGMSCTGVGNVTVTADKPLPFAYLVPAIAHNPGMAGTSWRTDLALVNTGAATATVRLDFHGLSLEASRQVTVPAGGTLVWRNVVETLFDVDAHAPEQGVIVAAASQPLVMGARNFNQTPEGTFGQYVPALAAGDGFGPGHTGHLPLLSKDAGSRTNIGLVNLGQDPVTIRVRLFDARGVQLGSPVTRSIAAGAWRQIDDIFATAGAAPTRTAHGTVEITGSQGEAWAYASVIDAGTGDGVTVPVIVE